MNIRIHIHITIIQTNRCIYIERDEHITDTYINHYHYRIHFLYVFVIHTIIIETISYMCSLSITIIIETINGSITINLNHFANHCRIHFFPSEAP